MPRYQATARYLKRDELLALLMRKFPGKKAEDFNVTVRRDKPETANVY
jgi:hypothetical protein